MNQPITQPRFLAVDFYCGAGGTTRGLLDAGGYVIAGIDHDSACRVTYERNNRNITLDREIPRFLNYDMFPMSSSYPHGQQGIVLERLQALIPHYRRIEGRLPLMFAICAPCQSFTTFVQRHLTQARQHARLLDQHLLSQTLAFIKMFLPEIILSENVVGIRKGKSRQVWMNYKRQLSILGYVVVDDDVCASNFGVPQYRNRAILIAIKADTLQNRPKTLTIPRVDDTAAVVSTWEAIGHLPLLSAGAQHPTDVNHICRNVTSLSRQRLSSLRPGETNRRLANSPFGDLSLNCHRRLEAKGQRGYWDVYTRLNPACPSPTITTRFISVSNGRFGHYDERQIRGLSLREGALLQSFPEHYMFYGDGMDSIARMIGNAVPPKLAHFMAAYSYSYVNSARISFSSSL